MAGYVQSLDMVAKLQAAGVAATNDPRSVTPPCVFITHTGTTYPGYCSGRVAWEVAAVAPGPWNADAWRLLDELEPIVAEVLNVAGYAVVSYRVALDSPPMPCYLFAYPEDVDL